MPLLAFITAFWLLVLGLVPAQAADTTVSFAPIIEWLLPLVRDTLIAGLTALAAWALALFKNKTGLDIEARHREALQSAIQRGVDYALNLKMPEGKLTLDVKNEMIALAADYVIRHTPDAMKYFGITASGLSERIIARLPQYGTLGEALLIPSAESPQGGGIQPVTLH